jgi:hypothetical protein
VSYSDSLLGRQRIGSSLDPAWRGASRALGVGARGFDGRPERVAGCLILTDLEPVDELSAAAARAWPWLVLMHILAPVGGLNHARTLGRVGER